MNENPLVLGALWLEALRPVSGHLTATLARIFRDRRAKRDGPCTGDGDPGDLRRRTIRGCLSDLLMDADPRAYASLFPVGERQKAEIVSLFRGSLPI